MSVSLVIVLLVLEAGVRILSPAPPAIVQPDPELGWSHPPSSEFRYDGSSGTVDVRFNARGLRGPEYGYEKKEGAFRILVLGDSYAEGLDVRRDELFTSELEKHFRDDGCDAEVVNGGVGGYGNDQELLFLELEGWKYDPDYVVLAMTLANDLSDNAGKGYCRLDQGNLSCPGPSRGSRSGSMIQSVKAVLQEHFDLYYFLRDRTERLYIWRSALNRLGLTEYNNDQLRSATPMPLSLFLEDEPPELAAAWSLTDSIIGRMASDAEERGVGFALALIPTDLQLDPSLFALALDEVGMEASDFDLQLPTRRMRTFASARSIPVVDLADTMAVEEARGRKLRDGHWNAAGHEVAAAAIYDLISSDLVCGGGE